MMNMDCIPLTWELNTLHDLVAINYGKSPIAILSENGTVPVVGTGGVERYGNDWIHDGESIILGRKGTIDKVTFVNGEFWAIDTAFYLTNFYKLVVKWLYYFLSTINFRYLNEATGVPSLSRDNLYKLPIPTPPFAEQTQIATILSTVDQAIEQTEALIAKQQRIKTGLMQDLLTKGIDEHGNIRSEESHAFKDSPLGRIPVEWGVDKIDNLLNRIIDYRGKTPYKSDYGVPLITAKIVRFGYLEEADEFIPEEEYEKRMTRGYPSKGDVLFTTEAPLGNVAQVLDERIALGQRLLTLKSGPRLNTDYLFYILMDEKIRQQFETLSSGSTVIGIKQSQFRKVLIRLPSDIKEQVNITSTIKSFDLQIDIHKDQLTKLKALKTGLMQDLLTGRVRVTPLLKE
ncbi:restriction endonuclease subunit S [Anaerolineales bacterium HSG24]|nr:restriction endonuclease subunit S [Anaerolineales bacterium HSG24]